MPPPRAVQRCAVAGKLPADLGPGHIDCTRGGQAFQEQVLPRFHPLGIQRHFPRAVQRRALAGKLPADLGPTHIDRTCGGQLSQKNAARDLHPLGEEAGQVATAQAQQVQFGRVEIGLFREMAEIKNRPAPGGAVGQVKFPRYPCPGHCHTTFVQPTIRRAAEYQQAQEGGADRVGVAGGCRAGAGEATGLTNATSLNQGLFRRGRRITARQGQKLLNRSELHHTPGAIASGCPDRAIGARGYSPGRRNSNRLVTVA